MNDKLIKLGFIQAVSFLLYIIGVFGLSLLDWDNPLIYFFTGLLMIGLMIVNGIYLVFYFMRGKKE